MTIDQAVSSVKKSASSLNGVANSLKSLGVALDEDTIGRAVASLQLADAVGSASLIAYKAWQSAQQSKEGSEIAMLTSALATNPYGWYRIAVAGVAGALMGATVGYVISSTNVGDRFQREVQADLSTPSSRTAVAQRVSGGYL